MAVNTSFRSPDSPEVEEAMMVSLEALRRTNYREILEHIRAKLGDRETHRLDVGCARGWFLDEAAKQGIAMDGIEPEHNFFIEAGKYSPNVIEGLFPQDFTITRKYDFIIFNDVFEHLPDLDSVLRKCSELLKPESLLIINCPDSRGIFFRIAKLMMKLGVPSYWRRLWQMDFYSPHLWYFDRENLTQIVAGYGFLCSGYSTPEGHNVPVFHQA
ncbi:MAG: class I SAM-dependent methyltransferase [Synergistaceae bacterium]|nr:class I SAM-dependent methyltransferase [Synergistaceae bacterium]